jgi:predicted RecA/RadA family phage recombinase
MSYAESYNIDPVAAFPGTVADMGNSVIISRTADVAVGFGVPVQQGAVAHSVKLMAAGATEVVGITVRSQATAAESANQYPAKDTAALMRNGVIWVTVTDAGGVAAGDPVWVKLADGTFSNADVGTDGSIKLAGCRWESAAANGAVAKIRVNLDVPAVAGAS